MSEQEGLDKQTALQLIRQVIRSRNLKRLSDGLERSWSVKIQLKFENQVPTAEYRIFRAALKDMKKEERVRAFQWTWDCYHPFMSDLGKALEDLDGFARTFH